MINFNQLSYQIGFRSLTFFFFFKIEVEVSIRADKLAAAGTEVKIEFTAFFAGNGDKNYKTDLTLTVVEKTATNLIPTTYTQAMKNRDM